MKTSIIKGILFAATLIAARTQGQTPLVGSGSSYNSIFTPASAVTYDVPGGGLLSLTLSNGVASASSGIWDLQAQGGANASLIGLGLLESAAQTQLTGSSLKFNISNDNNSLLGLLGIGASVHYGWQATAFFDTPGSQLNFSPFTTYHVSFDVDGSNGLLSSVAGLTPSFTFEFVDGSGNALTSFGSGTLINIAGLLGTGVPTGTINLDYTLGSSVASGPMGIRFTGDALVGATALSLGTDYATISNVSISAVAVPEPGGVILVAAVGVVVSLHRHRRRA